jgi:hypothetical protein
MTANKITDAIKALARAAQAMSLLVYAGGRSETVMPVAQYNQFEKLDRPIMQSGGENAAYVRWHELAADWDRCLDSVEDELVGRAPPSASGASDA